MTEHNLTTVKCVLHCLYLPPPSSSSLTNPPFLTLPLSYTHTCTPFFPHTPFSSLPSLSLRRS